MCFALIFPIWIRKSRFKSNARTTLEKWFHHWFFVWTKQAQMNGYTQEPHPNLRIWGGIQVHWPQNKEQHMNAISKSTPDIGNDLGETNASLHCVVLRCHWRKSTMGISNQATFWWEGWKYCPRWFYAFKAAGRWRKYGPEVVARSKRCVLPEILVGLPYNERADIWSLGLVVYGCVQGSIHSKCWKIGYGEDIPSIRMQWHDSENDLSDLQVVKAKRPTSKELLNILSKEYTSQQKLEHLITRGIRYFAEANSGNRIEYGVNEESKMEVIRGSDEMTNHSLLFAPSSGQEITSLVWFTKLSIFPPSFDSGAVKIDLDGIPCKHEFCDFPTELGRMFYCFGLHTALETDFLVGDCLLPDNFRKSLQAIVLYLFCRMQEFYCIWELFSTVILPPSWGHEIPLIPSQSLAPTLHRGDAEQRLLFSKRFSLRTACILLEASIPLFMLPEFLPYSGRMTRSKTKPQGTQLPLIFCLNECFLMSWIVWQSIQPKEAPMSIVVQL